MSHPLVTLLRFARSELIRALDGLSDEDARKRLMPMNSISWMIGHLAWQEQRYWLYRLQGKVLVPVLNEQFCSGCAAVTPPLDEMWSAWRTVTSAADPFLDQLTTQDLAQPRTFTSGKNSLTTNAGNLMNRTIGHYWYHIGEAMAIRQMLGHKNLPDFVGDIDSQAPYSPH